MNFQLPNDIRLTEVNLGLGKITAHVFSFNDASARVLEKCGFEQEGYLTKHFVKHGRLIDAQAFGLVR